jgi:putative acetyltransferase
MFEIRQDDLSGAPTQALLALHMSGMQANTPPEHVFALDLTALKAPGITVWSAWTDGEVAGVAALKELGGGAGEVKSMRTDPRRLRQGAASALLRHIICEARRRGFTRLSLETGVGDAFEPALALYRKHGFAPGGPFADYSPSAFNQFMHMQL